MRVSSEKSLIGLCRSVIELLSSDYRFVLVAILDYTQGYLFVLVLRYKLNNFVKYLTKMLNIDNYSCIFSQNIVPLRSKTIKHQNHDNSHT